MSEPEPAVLDFVERFAELLCQAGMPRMPSRVLTCLLAHEDGRMSSVELGEWLQISPAAISGAVRYLIQVDLVARERPAGSRRDLYRVYDDAWYEALTQRDQMLKRWAESLSLGVAALPAGSRSRARLAESLEFMEFLAAELPAMLQRWRDRNPASKVG